nr:MAG TPA: hypothetical protein [Bacteriophage sp.]
MAVIFSTFYHLYNFKKIHLKSYITFKRYLSKVITD